jgi:antitoxin MazE5
VSTTVDGELLEDVRRLRAGLNDAALLDEALVALRDQHRSMAVDAAYSVYDDRPLGEVDAWGDLASFGEAAAEA